MKITVEMDEQEFMQFMGWRNGVRALNELPICTDSTPILQANLSVRTKNVLLAEGITTVAQAQVMTDRELLNVPNLGRRSMTEFRDAYPLRQSATHPKD